MYYLVYKVTNHVNDKIYIGVHKTEDKNDGYIGSGKVLKRAIEKYGVEHFTKEILYECESKEEMFQKEADIVDEEFVSRMDTYNIKCGGFGGWDHIDSSGKNNPFYDVHYHRYGVDNPFYGKHHTKEAKISISKKAKECFKRQGHPWDGRKHTEESKKKIGKANSVHQSGEGNSHYGKCWIYSLKEKKSISIKKEELEKYIQNGWLKGRKMSF
jgi:hypothetical protein